jgi:hypothetical protein
MSGFFRATIHGRVIPRLHYSLPIPPLLRVSSLYKTQQTLWFAPLNTTFDFFGPHFCKL